MGSPVKAQREKRKCSAFVTTALSGLSCFHLGKVVSIEIHKSNDPATIETYNGTYLGED